MDEPKPPEKTVEKDRERKAMAAFAHALIAALYDAREGVGEVKASALETARHLAAIEGASAELSRQQAEIGQLLGVLARQNGCLEAAGRERQLLSEAHYLNHIVEPMVRQLFPLVDLLDDALGGVAPGAGGDAHRDLLLGLLSGLFDFLLIYGIEPIGFELGAAFDAKLMQARKVLSTADPAQHLRVVASLRRGFRRGEQILRYQSVAIHRCEASASA